MRVYLTGADGMLGTALTARIASETNTADWAVRGVSITDFDIADGVAVARSIADFAPDVVVHTAAHAIVDDCERNPRLAMRVNVAGTHHVAQACVRQGARLVYLSSDYVFDGRSGGYREQDVPDPLSVYGLTKLTGERIAASVPDHLVVRTSWLFGGRDPRLDTVLATVNELRVGGRPRLVADQYSSPTYVADLAAALTWLLPSAPDARGTLHVANQGRASWYEVGQLVRDLLSPIGRGEPEPLAMADCGFVGARPRDSHLDSGRLATFGWPMPHWSDAVTRHVARLTGEPAAPPGVSAAAGLVEPAPVPAGVR